MMRKMCLQKSFFFFFHIQVKNKKRWSQVMYMSYILGLRCNEKKHQSKKDTYMLTTDADIIFTYKSVKALMDLLDRDEEVGAVCARTHPTGSGPVVWYQVSQLSHYALFYRIRQLGLSVFRSYCETNSSTLAFE